MKLIIAGSRSITDYGVLLKALEGWDHQKYRITEVVSGHASGVDRLGERWAEEHHIPLKLFMADWTNQGMAAGSIRNMGMAMHSGGLLAVWDGVSTGTAIMIKMARLERLVTVIHTHHHLPPTTTQTTKPP